MDRIHFFPQEMQFICENEILAYQLLSFNLELNNSIISKKDIFNPKIINALLIQKDIKFLKKAQKIFQIGVSHLINEFNNNQHFSVDEKKDYLARVLCLLPYLEYADGAKISIPTWESNTWVPINLKIKKIKLSPVSIFLKPQDIVYAYGLYAPSQSFLIFSGTTYPEGEGFLSHIMTDFNGFQSVGENLINAGESEILAWMDASKIQKVKVYGTSLGGSMSLLWSCKHPTRTQEVFAFNPPGLLDIPKTESQMKVKVISQEHDLISRFGYWHPEWQVLEVKAPDHPLFHHHFFAHTLTFIGHKNASYSKINNEEENKKRFWLNLFVFKIFRSIFYLLVMLPFYYIIRPIYLSIYQELDWLAITGVLLLSFIGINPLLCILMGLVAKQFIRVKHQFEHFYMIALSLACLTAYFLLAHALPFLVIPIMAYLVTKLFDIFFPENPVCLSKQA